MNCNIVYMVCTVYINDSEYHVCVYWRQKVLQHVFLLYFWAIISTQDFKLPFYIHAYGNKWSY